MHNRNVKDLLDLTGKTALVTGASGYLGKALAEGLAEAGASVVVSSRSAERANEAAQKLSRTQQSQHFGIEIDHMDDASVDRGFARAVEAAGTIDILVNNGHEPTSQTWHNAVADDFTRQLANATGYFELARLLRNHAVERGAPASVVMLGSMYGAVGSYPEVYAGITAGSPVAYHVLKGGVLQMTRHLAVSWAPDRVRVNSLSPGPFPDPRRVPPELIERLSEKSPLKRMGTPYELKGAVVFLASDAASYVTGHNLVVDGGWTAW